MRFIGNKTQLLEDIKKIIDENVHNASTFCDIFSGTGTVGRYFKQWYEVYSNDLLYFSYCIQKGTIEITRKPEFKNLKSKTGITNPIKYFNEKTTDEMEILPVQKRLCQNNYSPLGNRMYFTESNALRIDYARNTIEDWLNKNYITKEEYFYLLASILEGIPLVSNISGTFGAFNKSWDKRANKLFELIEIPIINNAKNNQSFNKNGADLLKKIKGDILYIDPPYNQRQYLPNYHLLETVAKYDFPKLNGITGKRKYEGQRSMFCVKRFVKKAFDELLENANFKHIILSYNTDGIMSPQDIETIMKKHGKPNTFKLKYIPYKRFKSQSTGAKSEDLKEMLVYIQKEV